MIVIDTYKASRFFLLSYGLARSIVLNNWTFVLRFNATVGRPSNTGVRFTTTTNPLPPPPDSSGTASGPGKKVITGTDGPDILIETSDKNLISGLGEDDRIHGCGNNDVISGETGNDGS